MIIKEIQGDLLDAPDGINIIVHQANVDNVLGAGIALQIKKRYPEADKADTEAAKENRNRLGNYSIAHATVDDDSGREILIVNLYGQSIRHLSLAGIPTSYDAVYQAFTNLRNDLEENIPDIDNVKIGIPRLMGCALGGGDWDIYMAIIRSVFKDFAGQMVVVEYNKG